MLWLIEILWMATIMKNWHYIGQTMPDSANSHWLQITFIVWDSIMVRLGWNFAFRSKMKIHLYLKQCLEAIRCFLKDLKACLMGSRHQIELIFYVAWCFNIPIFMSMCLRTKWSLKWGRWKPIKVILMLRSHLTSWNLGKSIDYHIWIPL